MTKVNGSILAQLLDLEPKNRSALLNNSEELASTYEKAAWQGQTDTPDSLEDEVDYHFTCWVKSRQSGHMYELDGDSGGPVDTGVVLEHGQGVLSEPGLGVIKEFISRLGEKCNQLSLMALVQRRASASKDPNTKE